jgi:hypothetical protein
MDSNEPANPLFDSPPSQGESRKGKAPVWISPPDCRCGPRIPPFDQGEARWGSSVTGWNVITILVGALIPVLPQLANAVPQPYTAIATAVVGAIVLAWHLYQPSPSRQGEKK